MECPKREQGNVVLKQVSRKKACRLTQDELETKHQVMEEGTFLTKREKNAVPLKGLTRVSNCKEAVIKPWKILKFPEKQKNQETPGKANDISRGKSRNIYLGCFY